MEAVFSKVLDMSLTASYVIAAILLIRLLLKKAPKKYSYALWLVAAFRLVCPVSIESAFSLFNLSFSLGKTVGVTLRDVPEHSVSEYIPPVQNVTVPPPTRTPDILPSPTPGMLEEIPVVPAAPAATEPSVTLMGVLAIIWCVGIAALLVYSVVTYIKLKRQMSTAVLLDGNIRQAAGIRSPFILGFFRPQIYIPYHLGEAELSYVLAHERYHLKRRDHIIKPLAFLILAVHWFNPLVWLAFHLMVKDMEMSCDEKVLSRDASIRKDYSSTLLSFAAGRAFPAPSPLSFGEGSVKSRIKNILSWKKPALWLTVAAIIICIAVVAVCGTNPRVLLSMSEAESVYANGEEVSANAKAELITLINDHSKTSYRRAPDTVGPGDSLAIINCEDGSSYRVHYWYCSGFSFNPAHYGEDDYYTILSRLDAEGSVEKSWKMEYDFDKEFLNWLEVNSAENIYPFDSRFTLSDNIYGFNISFVMLFETADIISIESGGAFYADGELLGTFEQTTLTEDNWDNLFNTNAAWSSGSAKELRRNNFRAWRSINGDTLHYLFLQEDGSLYIAGGYYDSEGEYDPYSDDSAIISVWSLTEAAEDNAVAPADAYVPISCIYAPPHSSYYPWGGDSGCRYIIGSDSFTVERMDTGSMESYPVDSWNYSPLDPYSVEWTEMFIGDAPTFEGFNELLLLPVSDKYILLKLNGILHIAEKAGEYVWGIYAIIPEAQIAVWEYMPTSSSRSPWFDFRFTMGYERIDASCEDGTLLCEDDDGKEIRGNTISVPYGSTLRWLPHNEDGSQFGSFAGSAKILFTLTLTDGRTIQGTIYISSEDNRLYTATLRANGLSMSNDEEYSRANIYINFTYEIMVKNSAIVYVPDDGITVDDNAALISDAILDMFALSGYIDITPCIANEGKQKTLHSGHEAVDELQELIESCRLIPLDAPPPEPSDYWIEISHFVPNTGITLWSGSSDTLQYTTEDGTQYYRVEGGSPAESLLEFYFNNTPYTPEFTSNLSSLLNGWQEQGVTELSYEKLLLINHNFSPAYLYSGASNPLSSFFQCYYERPEDISLAAFLKYNAVSRSDYTESDFNLLKQRYPRHGQIWDSDTYEEAQRVGNPIHKFPREKIDEQLMEYAGITTADLSYINTDRTGLVYVEESDAYFNFTSDMGAGTFRAAAGEIVGDTVYLYNGYTTLTLRKSGYRWLIYSHTYDTEAATIASVANGILELFDYGGGMDITLSTSDSGALETVSVTDRAVAERISEILKTYSYTGQEAPAEQGEYWITIEPTAYVGKMVFGYGGPDTVQHSPSGQHRYYSASSPDGKSLAAAVREIYEGLFTRTGYEADSPEAAVEAYCAAVSSSPIANSNIIDSKIIEYKVLTVREDGNAVLGWKRAAVLPKNYDLPELWYGNAQNGTGEYEGWVVSTSEFVLKRDEDGLWYCTASGTSCYSSLY